MHKYSPEVINDVLHSVDIVEVVGQSGVELKAAGTGRLKACCPFHQEKTPSFVVTRDRQRYHCFGCGKGGDAIGFTMEHGGLTFLEALRLLAERGGVRLPALSMQDDKEEYIREQLTEFNQFACAYYKRTLGHETQGSLGRQYLQQRQLKNETLEQFDLGYVPDGWNNLLDETRKGDFKRPVVAASGMFKDGDRGFYDFFRNRVIFPIRDVSGKVVAFGGRDLGDSPAKYINSPETLIYKKSRTLYGLFYARDAMRQQKQAILVEGYFDALRCYDTGIDNVVASCGTALTPEQASLIRRYVPEVVLVYDGDPAGVKAAMKGSGILVSAGLSVRAMALPDNQDPDDFILEAGADAFRKLVEDAPDFVTFYARMSKDRAETIEGRSAVAREIFEILNVIPDTLRVDEYLKHVSRELRLSEVAVRRSFTEYREGRVHQQHYQREEETVQSTAPVYSHDDSVFLAVVMTRDDLREKVAHALKDLVMLKSVLASALECVLQQRELSLESEAVSALYSAACAVDCAALHPEAQEEVVERRLNRFRRDVLESKANANERALQDAIHQKDNAQVLTLMQEQTRLRSALDKVGAA